MGGLAYGQDYEEQGTLPRPFYCDHKMARNSGERRLTDSCRFAICGGLPFATCLLRRRIAIAHRLPRSGTSATVLRYALYPLVHGRKIHHEEELADPSLLEAFKRFVALETELADLLATSAEEDRQLLEQSQPTDK